MIVSMPTIVSIVSMLALVASVLFLAFQTRAQTRQTKIANQEAAATTRRHAMSSINTVVAILVEHPELVCCFYSGEPPPEDPIRKSQVERVSELMAEALETALDADM